jgi:hypothetical protein
MGRRQLTSHWVVDVLPSMSTLWLRRASSNIRSAILSQGAGDGLLIRRLSSTITSSYLAMCGSVGTPEIQLQPMIEGRPELLGRHFFLCVPEVAASPTPCWILTRCHSEIWNKTIETDPLHLLQIERTSLLLSMDLARLRHCK